MDKDKLIEMIENAFGISFQGFLQEIDDPEDYIGSRFLPEQEIYDYDWKQAIIDNTVAMARPLARGDAEAPIIGGPALKEAVGSVAGWGQKFQVNKKVLNKIFNPRNDNEYKQTLRQVLDESARNVRAAQQRREWLRWQFLSKGQIIVTEGEANMQIDMGVPDEHKYDVSALTAAWDDAGNAEPISDYIMMCEEYYDENDQMPDTSVMRRQQVRQILNSAEARAELTDNDSRAGLQTLNSYLEGLGYPTIETYDEFVRLEDEKGRPTSKEYLIPEGRITFLKEAENNIELDIGRMMMGPVAENDFQPGIYTTIYEETDPMKVWHFMATEMFPASYNPEYVMFADVVNS